ncbi:hypothetical protein HYT57_02230 [Candidatus Woesearchaeota archaeon]|nr:hypothetical protein [Candidatus Woesearchaeota archaeon]
MVSVKDIQAVYENPDLMLVSKGDGESPDNFACDTSSKTNVLKLLDGRVKYKGNEVYVPGESFLLPYRSLEKTVNSRRNLIVRGVNIYPTLVDYIMKYRTHHGFTSDVDVGEKNEQEIDKWCGDEGLLEEIVSFVKIRINMTGEDGNVDDSGLVLVQALDPVTPLKRGYEFNGVFHSHYRLGKIDIPVEVTGENVEFTFLSDCHANISDGDKSFGRYKDGILTLERPHIFVNEINGNLNYSKSPRGWKKPFSRALGLAFVGGGGGSIVGVLSGIFVSLSTYGMSCVLGLPTEDMHQFLKGTAITYATGFAGLGAYVGYSTGRAGHKIVPSGNPTMNITFYGRVKDRRFEGVEEILNSLPLVN